ncbi:MAG: FAD-dependent thymidylate synthase [Pseudomonadota bacterium]|nr:FAD-dependent thymidylate synthase [Pseudomonadota bacterium]
MKVVLAGYNIDYETIMDIEDRCEDLEELTPETIAAAYARISRSPRPVNELRAIARGEVDKARQSNRTIVFEMGHGSIAEHAVFNLDILGVSRLLVEDIERFRLCSYTEKSQRYVLFQDDFVVPEEIEKAGLAGPFAEVIRRQNSFYRECYERLRPHVFARHPELAGDPAHRSLLEGWAKEDARYAIALATETQLGMTLNARNLELMVRRLAAHPLKEARDLSAALYKATRSIAPSLVRYTEATDYDLRTRRELREAAAALFGEDDPDDRERREARDDDGTGAGRAVQPSPGSGDDAAAPTTAAPTASRDAVFLAYVTPEADLRLLAALLHSSSRRPLSSCLSRARRLDAGQRMNLVKTALRHLRSHDAVLREFEYVDLLFELTVSAGCFAQLKRHRMATITAQGYDPGLGVVMPPSIAAIGMDESFRKLMDDTGKLHERLRETEAAEAAPYILTNAHRRRVALKVNARELYHIARLRADRHAQWDIRELTTAMLAAAERAMPLTLLMAAGKDGFADLYRLRFGN